MISWKLSFKRLNEECETAKKKKQALDGLFDAGRISQATYDLFNMEISETIHDIEKQQKVLVDKMNSKVAELDEQIRTLEILLANFEIQHVTGDIDEEAYNREVNVLTMGLDTSRQELSQVKEAVAQLSSGNYVIGQDPNPGQAQPSIEEPVEKIAEAVVEVTETANEQTINNEEKQQA